MRGVRLRWVWSGAVAVLPTWFFGRSDIGMATLPAFPLTSLVVYLIWLAYGDRLPTS
jgi:hypothetical protein